MASDDDKARYNYENYRYCYDNGHSEWLELAQRCIRAWHNKSWDAADKAAVEASGRPALEFGTIESLVRAMKGIQRAMRNDVRFSPVADADAASAAVQDELWLQIQNQNDLDFLETDMYERGLITGRGYYDIRLGYDEQLQGQVEIDVLRSQDVVLDPMIDKYNPDGWPQVITRRWVSIQDIEHMFGKGHTEALRYNGTPTWYDFEDSLAAERLGALPRYAEGNLPQEDLDRIRAYMLIDRQYYDLKRKEVFIDVSTGDMSEIPETWDHNRISHVLSNTPGLITMYRVIKTVHWTVSCETELLHDEDSPFKWFTVVPYFPTFMDGISMGAVEGMLDPALLFNKVTSQELHIINTTANSGYKVKRNSLRNMTIEELEQRGSKSGVVFELDEIGDLEKLTPSQVPTGHDRISMKADQIMRSQSGVSQQARGFAREDVAGEAILSNQAASDVNFAGWLGNLHRTKRILAARALDCVQSAYTEERVLLTNKGSVFRPDVKQTTINQATPTGEVLNDVTKGKYTTVLVPSPARSLMNESEFKELVMLRKELGVAIPDTLLLELSNAANKGRIIQQLTEDSNAAQKAQQEAEQRNAEAELALTAAKTAKEQGAAQLNQARAQKALVESQTDPDAAYREIEGARVAADERVKMAELALDQERIGMERRMGAHRTAVDLTRISAENARHQAKMQADAKKSAKEPTTQKGEPA